MGGPTTKTLYSIRRKELDLYSKWSNNRNVRVEMTWTGLVVRIEGKLDIGKDDLYRLIAEDFNKDIDRNRKEYIYYTFIAALGHRKIMTASLLKKVFAFKQESSVKNKTWEYRPVKSIRASKNTEILIYRDLANIDIKIFS